MGSVHSAVYYLELGFEHIWPLGLDHILFITSIFLINSRLKQAIIQCTVFTLAHSITLVFTALGILFPNPIIVEPLIAFSILVTSLENIFTNRVGPSRLLLIFLFGLMHGMGFASALLNAGIEKSSMISSFIFFNIGVELGQVSIILLLYYSISFWFSEKSWYNTRIV